MEIQAAEMKKFMEKIHDKLDKVQLVDFDCGNLCGAICCTCESEDLALYLLPGEELLYENSDSFELYHIDAKDFNFPRSWKDGVFLVKCTNPPVCERKIRPIQCMTFPLVPHINKKNEFHLIIDESEFPYVCPVVRDNIKINNDFIIETYKVWRLLLNNPLVYDLVDMDSRLRENRKIDYKVVI